MSNIKEILKNNNTLRRCIKKLKIYKEYMNDAREYSTFYMEKSDNAGRYSYRIMLLVHSLEKGMCMKDTRPYGQKKAAALMNILKKCNDIDSFEYNLGVSVLKAWVDCFDENNWKNDFVCEKVRQYVSEKKIIFSAGRKEFKNPISELDNNSFDNVILSRHSVRDFLNKEISKDDLEFALKCFIEAPSACNRQMCKVYQVYNQDIKDLLNETLLGVSGFNKKTVTYFVVTYDIAAFDFYGERNQGYFNAGLAAMNFANALHSRGIGSCFLQWANKKAEDMEIRRAMKMPRSEKIAVVIGAGYYNEKSTIPCSCRKEIKDIYVAVK